MVGYKWVLKYIITNLGAPALAPHGTINNDVIQVYAGTLNVWIDGFKLKNGSLLLYYCVLIPTDLRIEINNI